MDRRRTTLIVLISTLVVVMLIVGASSLATRVAASASSDRSSEMGAGQPPALQGETGGALTALEGTLQGIYERVNPSVVSVRVIGGSAPLFGGEEIPGLPSLPQPRPQSGEGSGFLWDSDGHIVTNYHVVEGAETIYVDFADGNLVSAEVVGVDPESDLAVLQVEEVDGFELPDPVSRADADDLAVGQVAIAIGNPFGEEGTMTLGIISGLGRLLPNGAGTLMGRYSIPDIIQTDASINPGNSGGALLNDQGELIGVPTAIASSTGSNSGVGYAIPVNIVERVVPALIEDGEFQNPYLGISGLALTPPVSEAIELEPTQQGVLVVEVVPDGPAADAGLRGSDDIATIDGAEVEVGGDVITAIDGEAVEDIDDLISYLANNGEVGETVELTILRDGDEERVEVTLQVRPETTAQAPTVELPEQLAPFSQQGVQLGILGTDLTPDVVAEERLPEKTEGVLVQQVLPDSAAERADLQPGDVITQLDGDDIATVTELREALSELEAGDSVELTILRDGEEASIEVTFSTVS